MVKGIIFDMDGVISDTQKLHAAVEAKILNRFGVNITPEELTRKYSGVRTGEFFDVLLKQQGAAYDLDGLMKEKWGEMAKLASLGVDEIPGSVDLIKRLYEEKYPLALASASTSDYVHSVLEALKITPYFSAVVSGDMVANGKPDPESFLLAASKIGVAPQDCVVIEDGINGMEGAKRANMFCIGLVKDKNGLYPTNNLIMSLSEITSDYLKNLK
ncbi:MAG: HAD family phosphatase [Candidatus Portnoybacteria bacterium]|nr:HAD family phosphatase [Candidatus Portnoybacteria bacterium]MDD4982703.1 HAD family phosphatase [Candidatus Portnoybacteria bacterium]